MTPFSSVHFPSRTHQKGEARFFCVSTGEQLQKIGYLWVNFLCFHFLFSPDWSWFLFLDHVGLDALLLEPGGRVRARVLVLNGVQEAPDVHANRPHDVDLLPLNLKQKQQPHAWTEELAQVLQFPGQQEL